MKKYYREVLLIILFVFSYEVFAARIKDIATLKGTRDNQLIGYGLVIGLQGTGDSKLEFTGMSMSNMLRNLGVDIKSEMVTSKNVAAVVVTANMPAFSRVGSRMSVTVNSVGDAKSLQGGTLLYTPLRGGDNHVYAVAQGPLSIGGIASGGSQKPHTTVGFIPEGAIVEKEVNSDFSDRNALRLALNHPDFTTAARISKIINGELGGIYARARDAGTIDVVVPYDFEGGVVEMIATIERLSVEEDNKARVVINERTGTVVIGKTVKLSPVAISHGDLTLEIKAAEAEVAANKSSTERKTASVDFPSPDVNNSSQNNLSVKESIENVNKNGDKLIYVNEGSTLGEVVKGLNALGVKPKDMIAILQALKSQGALQAELEIF